MRVLVACEESQVVCKAFRERGHEAFSNDIQECSGGYPEWHIQEDSIEVAYREYWDMMICHPPCTYTSYAGIRWFNYQRYGSNALARYYKRLDGVQFALKLWNAPIDRICLENPRGYIQEFLPYSQLIHPYYFGDSCSKATLLWLKNLPCLVHQKQDSLFDFATHVDKGEMTSSGSARLWANNLALPEEERKRLRSKTFDGIAKAMAEQWG